MTTDRNSQIVFLLKSTRGPTSLRLSAPTRDTYQARLNAERLRAQVTVQHMHGDGIGGFFRELAQEWRGWGGEKDWGSLEGDLLAAATSDRTGHIHLRVRVQPLHRAWDAEAVLVLEAGQLDVIALTAERFAGHLQRG